MRLAAVALGIALMAGLTPLQAAASSRADIQTRALSAPMGGEDMLFRLAFHQRAQQLSDGMFGALQKVLGGDAPKLNFVQDIGTDGFHSSAHLADNTINADPSLVQWLIDDNSPFHSSGVNAIPHEMAHLRQTPQVLASVPDREGGAQAFADLVSPIAAASAKTNYIPADYDGSYGPFVKAAQAKGRDFIFGSQFGHAPVSWP